MYTWGFLQTDVIAFDVSVCVCSLRCYNSRWSCFVLYVNNRCWFRQDVQCVNADRTLPSLTLTAAGALIEVSYALVPSSLSPQCPHTHTQMRSANPHTCMFTLRKPRRRFGSCSEEAGVTVSFKTSEEDMFVREFSGKFHVQSCQVILL